jgi:aminoglycoside phosphotransferase family enzyme/predicted kinase
MELAVTGMSPHAEVHETHTGLVVLVGDKAYKVKKPVVTDFLDFSTTDRRERVCAREVLLNSRLAPAAYLGIAHFNAPSGDVTEPVIVMRRYPESRRLATLLKPGGATQRELAKIAEVLAGFHYRAHHSLAIDAQATPEAISARWCGNLAELHRFEDNLAPADILDKIHMAATSYIAGRSALFAQRISDRRIIDGHGDLLADDIFCMESGPVLLDCLEFDDRLRYVDGMDDAAFLAMDVEFLGRQDLAEYFLDAYSYSAGDDAPISLRHFYIAYRALVRAKVDCMRFAQGNADAKTDAPSHLSLALEHLRSGTVRLVLVGGAPGTGKTTLAHALADQVGAEVISTDDVRRDLQLRGAIDGTPGSLDAGLYEPHKMDAVYRETIERAKKLLAHGQSVILDATWRDPRRRHVAKQLATETMSTFLEIACWTSVDVAVERVRSRSPEGTSEVTPLIAKELTLRDDDWNTALLIDTAQALPDCVDQAEKLWEMAI